MTGTRRRNDDYCGRVQDLNPPRTHFTSLYHIASMNRMISFASFEADGYSYGFDKKTFCLRSFNHPLILKKDV